MAIEIRGAQEDKYGNRKENIFIAFDEQDQYLGNGYVYPTINHHQTYETPYLLFIEVSVKEGLEKSLAEKVRQDLLDAVLKRAKVLRQEKSELKCRLYAGFEYDKEKLDFYLRYGFEEDYSIFMEADLLEGACKPLSENEDKSEGKNQLKVVNQSESKDEDQIRSRIRMEGKSQIENSTSAMKESLPKNMHVRTYDIGVEENLKNFKELYDEYFVTPLDSEEFAEAQKQDTSFKNFNFYIEDELVGECSVREEKDCGWIEILYIVEGKRGMGLSRNIMNYCHQYFLDKGLTKAKLEVWQLNTRAVKLYESLGYREAGKNCMFPGITL